MQKPIVVVGSINIDLVAAAERIPFVGETVLGHAFNVYCGGKGANQAVAAAKLGYPVTMIGCVGDDMFSTQLSSSLQSAGVNIDNVATVPGSSGVALITASRAGENNIVYVPGANDRVTPAMIERKSSVIQSAGAIMSQLEMPYETVEYLADLAYTCNIPFILDPAPARELSSSVLRKVAWLTPNETEITELLRGRFGGDTVQVPEAIESLQCAGARNVLLKLGSRGCVIAQRGIAQHTVPAFSVSAVDTTAAGDAFNGAFVVALLRGSSLQQAALFASAVAAISVTRPGAQPSMPAQAEVEQFLQQNEPTQAGHNN